MKKKYVNNIEEINVSIRGMEMNVNMAVRHIVLNLLNLVIKEKKRYSKRNKFIFFIQFYANTSSKIIYVSNKPALLCILSKQLRRKIKKTNICEDENKKENNMEQKNYHKTNMVLSQK